MIIPPDAIQDLARVIAREQPVVFDELAFRVGMELELELEALERARHARANRLTSLKEWSQ